MRVRFGEGAALREVEALPGERLLDVARRDGQPLEGTCNGELACATCHVIVAAEDFDRLPPASEEEEDMLDLAPGARRTSRLACQIVLTPALDKLSVCLPGGSG
ncbi:2Fe-2S iron-sulfur cluster binding domain-containing protein [Sphingomonas sp. RHCKR7]|uniref:2Fe-2S iron-sulfur cluster-binding protein n=1 Tax=Sphingomonas folli TaxID=2862497 RepID=UPI001CA46F41|nr:2Fe-2S iron-sulfur cluster-binding protein [Sphingomonas folli]MBW6525603.1 2Fe-2S iron-sulfur cluster binding domain-containing protein [Sphingomonas folli]